MNEPLQVHDGHVINIHVYTVCPELFIVQNAAANDKSTAILDVHSQVINLFLDTDRYMVPDMAVYILQPLAIDLREILHGGLTSSFFFSLFFFT